MPATPCSAPLIGQDMIEIDGAPVPSRPYLGVYTQPLSFIGLPIVAVPLRAPGELPIGVQIVAAPWRESDALRAARALERDGVASAEAAVSWLQRNPDQHRRDGRRRRHRRRHAGRGVLGCAAHGALRRTLRLC